MKTKFLQLLVALSGMWVAQFAANAQAAITCNITSSGFTTTYPVASPTAVVVMGSYSISCTRGDVADSLTTTYTVQASNGSNPGAGSNHGSSGAGFIAYDVYSDSGCGTKWKLNPQAARIPPVVGTITMSGLVTTTIPHNYWGCIPAGLSPAAGTYIDSVEMRPIYTGGVIPVPASFPVTIITPPTCTISTGPSPLTINYVAFGGSASASTPVGVTCSASLPYTMAVSPANAVLTGILYGLTLPGSATGTGAAQSHTITATATGGQAGSCSGGPSCSATQATTFTVSY